MLNYSICEINGKQYKILPGVPVEVDYHEDNKDIETNVLIKVVDGKMEIGRPYLEEKLVLKFVEITKGKKIRVGKYHAKANYRRSIGIRAKFTKFLLPVKKLPKS